MRGSVLVVGLLTACAPSADDATITVLFRDLHTPIYQLYDLGNRDLANRDFANRDLGNTDLGKTDLGKSDLGDTVDIDRDALHDLLAASFAGEALTHQYIEHFTTLTQMHAEGTSIDVIAVDYETVRVLDRDPSGVRVEADWSVGGVVRHSRHRHTRTNRYQAVYTLAQTDAGWRIVDTKLRNLERVAIAVDPLDDLPDSGAGFMNPLEMLRAGVGEDETDEDESNQDDTNDTTDGSNDAL